MLSWSFTKLCSEPCLYICTDSNGIVITAIQVDIFSYASSTTKASEMFKANIRSQWEFTNLGELKFVVGIAVEQNLADHTALLSQTTLIIKIHQQFSPLANVPSRPPSTPMLSDSHLRKPVTPIPPNELS